MEQISSVLKENQFQQISNDSIDKNISQELYINWKQQSVFIKGKPVYLSHYEFHLFVYLAKHPGWIFSKEELYEAVWNESGELCGSAVANMISQIRRKLRQAGAEREYIQTVVNSGYRFLKEN